MELGQKIKQARLAAGLSQRQLCADVITRNMLSQIENGSARPSMQTLTALAQRLGKPVSFFLEEDAVCSPNQHCMAQARAAWETGDAAQTLELLKTFRMPDPIFAAERQLLVRLATLAQAELALQRGQKILAQTLLEQETMTDGYCGQDLERRRLLLLAKAAPQKRGEICDELPELDDELLLRAQEALERGDKTRSEQLLEAMQNKQSPPWLFARAEVYYAQQEYRAAAQCYHRVEKAYPMQTAARLERCYRALEDYKQAYYYACQQRGTEE